MLQEDFEEYAEKAKALPETQSTSNEDKLILYGLFKHATVGVANTGMHVC
uniref:ACB domain-containing protein n=1 Tax=Aegilops tauschii subsp. strangulata TaxID=200361 RepID=A0A453RWM5_AEGTS